MTLPASGIISISQFNTELGQAATYAGNLYWVGVNSKSGSYSMAAHYGEAYYQKTNAGNCNNGNCAQTYTTNCGSINCYNCLLSATQCINCDARAWLQANCNCTASYQCNASLVSFNCDCACNC